MATLSKVEAEQKCACGAMSEQDCHDLPSLRHCGGAEVTSAPIPAPVSEEREELAKLLDDVIAHPHREARRKMWNALPRIATALRTPHGLPGEEELVLLMRQNLNVTVSDYGLSADIEGIEDAARAILSRLTASREDV